MKNTTNEINSTGLLSEYFANIESRFTLRSENMQNLKEKISISNPKSSIPTYMISLFIIYFDILLASLMLIFIGHTLHTYPLLT